MSEPQSYVLPQSVADAVRADGLSRVALDQLGGQHVLYREGAVVRSMLAADWPPPLPTDPTAEQIAAALAAQEQARQQQDADAAALRQKVVTTAQSAVGTRVDQLDGSQIKAILAALLHRFDAIDKELKVKPLQDWIKK